MLMRTKDYTNQLLATLGGVALGYSIALQIDVSGPIAMVVAGLVAGNVTMPRLAKEVRAPLQTFWSGIDEVLNSLLFVMIGLMVVVVHSLPFAPLMKTLPIAILVCLIVRAVSVYVPITALMMTRTLDGDRNGVTKLLTWGGLRGGLALALALSLPESHDKPLIPDRQHDVRSRRLLRPGPRIDDRKVLQAFIPARAPQVSWVTIRPSIPGGDDRA
jgi:CPA1 family monovalent cation:H+ antiporter